MQLLGFGLSFTMSHRKRNLIDFVAEMDKGKKIFSDFGCNFISMNLDMIFQRLLKFDFNDFLPRRFRIALKQIKDMIFLRSCKSDKGSKIVVMDINVYNCKINDLPNKGKVYIS